MHGMLNKSGYVRINMSRVYGTNAPYSTVTQFIFQTCTARNSLQ